jgi:hypothetical protein
MWRKWVDFVICDDDILGSIQHSIQDAQVNIHNKPRATRAKHLGKITENGDFSMYLGSGRSGVGGFCDLQ